MSNRAVIVILLALVSGAGGGYFYAVKMSPPGVAAPAPASAKKPMFYRNPMNPAITSPVPAKNEMGMAYIPIYADGGNDTQERKILFYRHPMNVEITSPAPAQDDMGMDYVPVYADGGGSSPSDRPGTVTIDPVIVQNIGVRTAQATRQSLAKTIRAVGRVAYDEQGLTRLHPKTEGWIEKLYIRETGVLIKRHTILLSIYSPQLVSTQQEYLLALNSREILSTSSLSDIRTGAEGLVQSARERLRLLDVPEHQIRELEESRDIKKSVHIHSPFKGVVVSIGAREGQYVTKQTELYLLADLSRVWAYADIYEDDLPWVNLNDAAEMEVVGIPGEIFLGNVTYIYPYLETKSRTIKVRLEFDNAALRLKPGMYTNVRIRANEQVDAVVVPSESIVRSGNREQVFIDLGDGKFEPREVKIGVSSDGLTQILEGLAGGEKVVVSSQFLIDSESKLREVTAKMLEVLTNANKEASDRNERLESEKKSSDAHAHSPSMTGSE